MNGVKVQISQNAWWKLEIDKTPATAAAGAEKNQAALPDRNCSFGKYQHAVNRAAPERVDVSAAEGVLAQSGKAAPGPPQDTGRGVLEIAGQPGTRARAGNGFPGTA